ncbi:MAG: amidohydrolase family protein [Sphaerochaetaceae bacterium]|jgi:imidazolonepropionase-like amidohydrolase|nr:amidohydrolase family protein [Sphaerochaetaceae bacterium]
MMITKISSCNVFDGKHNELLCNKTVYIQDNKILKIGDLDTPIKPDIEIDGKGKYLIPGLINLHVHINRRHLSRGTGVFRQGAPAVENSDDGRRMLYAAKNAWFELFKGITTMRDLCSVGRTANYLRDAIQAGQIRGPRLITCGMAIAATGGHETHRYVGAVQVDGADEVTKATRYEIRLGADFIKLMVSGGLGGMPEHEHPSWSELNVTEITAACEAAHSHNRGVTVHAMGELPVLNALHGGVDGIEHGAVLTEEALRIMKDRNVYYIPTASGITAVAEKEAKNGSSELAETMRALVVDPQRESIRKAHERGILIGAGSDTLGSVLAELLIFSDCGLSNTEALKTATSNAAKILKLDEKIGYVREGYLADLVLLDENPLEDLHALEKVHTVFKDGNKVTFDWVCNLV